MKKNTGKFITLFLAVIMLLGALSIMASAATKISSVTVTGVTAPVAGASASWNFSVPSGKGYSKRTTSSRTASWVETDTMPTNLDNIVENEIYYENDSFSFKPNKYYTFVAWVKADSGYQFASNPTATLNGKTAYFEDGTFPIVWCCFGKPATAISSVSVTGVTAPVTGAAASWNYTIPSGKGYSKYVSGENNYGYWSETSTTPTNYDDVVNGSRKYVSNGSFTFKADKYYTFVAWVKTNSGYQITNSTTAKINGKTSNVYTGNTGSFPIWYCFGKPATAINTISVTGVTAPVAGASASWNYTIPSGAGYSKYAGTGNNYGYWSETSATPTNYADVVNGSKKYMSTGSFTFKADKYYTFVAWVKINSGYQITNSTTAKINGKTSNFYTGYTGYFPIWYCFGKVTKTLSSISVTTQPTKKAYTAGDAFNRDGMVVKATYSDGSSAAVTNYFLTSARTLSCNQTSLKISYTENGITKATTVAITVAHKLEVIDGEEATCTAPGLTDGEKCSDCGKVTKERTTIKALGHEEGYGSDFVAPECEYDGVTEEIICERCGIVLKPAKTIPATGHNYKSKTTKATTSKDGKTVKTCENCSKKVTTTIYKVTSFKLSTTSYTYDGKAKTPSVTVKDSKGKTLKKDTDYTVKYASGRKSVGKYTVTVTLKGKYSGTKSLSFTINPKATSKITVTQTTTSIKATWSKVSGATGYKVYIYKGSKLVASKTVSAKTTSYSFTKLTAGTNYTVKVKAYQTVSKVNYWSSTKSLATATKTKTPSITSVKAGSKSATVKWSNVSGENGYQVYYATSKNGTYKKGATTKANDIDATIKSLTKGKTYYFKVRAYKTVDSGTVYSAWSAVKSVKAK